MFLGRLFAFWREEGKKLSKTSGQSTSSFGT